MKVKKVLQGAPSRHKLDEMLEESNDLFQEPKGLPPICPIVVRSYHYPHLLKDEIENQCDQMLQQGIIRLSISPFFSLVLLVRKEKDEASRRCVDYRELNAKTIKDKFSIR